MKACNCKGSAIRTMLIESDTHFKCPRCGGLVPRPCPKCNGTGWHSYDHNHSKRCAVCCTHDEGWYDVTAEHHASWYVDGGDNRCCKAGCGTMFRDVARAEREAI